MVVTGEEEVGDIAVGAGGAAGDGAEVGATGIMAGDIDPGVGATGMAMAADLGAMAVRITGTMAGRSYHLASAFHGASGGVSGFDD
jgi:hypothetical protein